MNRRLSILDTLKYAFKTYAHHFFLLFFATFLVEISVARPLFINPQIPPSLIILGIMAVATLLYLFLFLGLRQIALDLYYTQKSSFGRLFSCSKNFLTFLGASLLFIVCISIALALFAFILVVIAYVSNIGGIQTQSHTVQSLWNALPLWYLILIVALLLPLIALVSAIMFYPYFILDKQSGAFESIKQSYHAARTHLFTIGALIIIFWAINYTIMNPFILTNKAIWNVIIKIAGTSLIKPLELLSYVYVYAHIKGSHP